MSDPPLAGSSSPSTVDPSTTDRIRGLLARLYPKGWIGDDRRSATRYPFPYLITVSPVESDGVTPLAKPFSAVAKHISETGLGFYHTEMMPYRYVVASVSAPQGDTTVHMLIDLTWCRFARKGWYENGGVLIGETDEPVLAGLVDEDE